jgi:hypothetical protein
MRAVPQLHGPKCSPQLNLVAQGGRGAWELVDALMRTQTAQQSGVHLQPSFAVISRHQPSSAIISLHQQSGVHLLTGEP